MSEKRTISIAREFSSTPYGRYRKDGPESGEVFRDDWLIPALKRGAVELRIDGLDGLPSSFWEEALGGLVRKGYELEELQKLLTIVGDSPEFRTFIRSGWRFMEEAASKQAAH